MPQPVVRYLVPSRGRPGNVRRLWRAWQDTDAVATLVVILDQDDPSLEEYFEDHTIFGNEYTVIVTPPLGNLGPILNEWGTRCADRVPEGGQAHAIGFMGDDHMPRTSRWDQELYASLQPHGIVYGNDLLMGPNLPTAVMLDADIVRKLGWMIPPGLRHMYLDNFWKDLGGALGTLAYRGDIVIEHMHPVAGKAAEDDRYRVVNSDEIYAEDAKTYAEFVNGGGLQRAVETIRG
jgi:hypothetical protein